jgi:hypothetical protein
VFSQALGVQLTEFYLKTILKITPSVCIQTLAAHVSMQRCTLIEHSNSKAINQ